MNKKNVQKPILLGIFFILVIYAVVTIYIYPFNKNLVYFLYFVQKILRYLLQISYYYH